MTAFEWKTFFCLESHIHLCSRHTSAIPAYVIKTCVTWHAISGTRYWGFVSPKLHISTYRNQQHCWWFHDTWQNPMRVSLPREGECARELGLRESLFKRVQRGCIHNAITKIVPLRYSPWVVGVFNNITGGTNRLVFKWVSSGVPKWFLKVGGWRCDEPMGDAVHERQTELSSAVTQGVPAKVLEQGCGTHSLSPGLVTDNPSGPSIYALKGVYILLLIGVPHARAVFQFRAY